MRIRCYTDYFIQLDEDMQLYTHAIKTIYDTYNKNKFLNIYRLNDDYLGISKNKWIYGVKLYNQTIMKLFPTFKDTDNNDVVTSAVDRCWHINIKNAGYKSRPFILSRNIISLYFVFRNIVNE